MAPFSRRVFFRASAGRLAVLAATAAAAGCVPCEPAAPGDNLAPKE